MVTLLLAATIRPSVPGAVYFIVFLGAATCWACLKALGRYFINLKYTHKIKNNSYDFSNFRAFAIICRIVLVFLAVHIAAFLAYQTPWPQEFYPANSTYIR